MLELATRAGLRLDSERPDLLPYQTFLVFQKRDETESHLWPRKTD